MLNNYWLTIVAERDEKITNRLYKYILSLHNNKNRFPLPLIEDCVDVLDRCKYFSTYDLASGYYQIEVEEVDKAKTAFVTKHGLYQFKMMCFGLCNAPATFSRTMALVLKGLTWKSLSWII